jgi:hypothetical protein
MFTALLFAALALPGNAAAQNPWLQMGLGILSNPAGAGNNPMIGIARGIQGHQPQQYQQQYQPSFPQSYQVRPTYPKPPGNLPDPFAGHFTVTPNY